MKRRRGERGRPLSSSPLGSVVVCFLVCECGGAGGGLFVAFGGGVLEFDLGFEFAGFGLVEFDGDDFLVRAGFGCGGEAFGGGFAFAGGGYVDGEGDGVVLGGVFSDEDGVGAVFDFDGGGLFDERPVLRGEGGGDGELLAAEAAVRVGGDVGRE